LDSPSELKKPAKKPPSEKYLRKDLARTKQSLQNVKSRHRTKSLARKKARKAGSMARTFERLIVEAVEEVTGENIR